MELTYARVMVLLAFLAAGARPVAAQLIQREVTRTPTGIPLDFTPDGGWRRLARNVADYRRAMLASGNFTALNARVAPGVAHAAAVHGSLKIPTIMFRYQDAGTAASFPVSDYQALLFGASPPAGRPYSIKTFYQELSNGLLDIDGTVVGWISLPGVESNYTGGNNCGPGTPGGGNPNGGAQCNGIYSDVAYTALMSGFKEALARADTGVSGVDFGQFDNDGPDGVPNSGDDDGFVDMALFVHSERDGACFSTSNGHVWSHRGFLSSPYTTNDPSARGGFIRVQSYTVQSGLGGSSGCDSTQLMAIGTAAHETGHAFGLPDLYDTEFSTEGIGQWGLMGSGNYTSAFSPARMEAWSLNELGWVTLRPITTTGTYSFGPAPASDTAFVIRVQGTNSRKEYYLLENRQGVQADSAMLRFHCQKTGLSFPASCHGGLAIWHADSTKLQAGKATNSVNAGTIHGLVLVQADGQNHLNKTGSAGNRGDAGDVWPGYGTGTPKTTYTLNSAPPAVESDSLTFVGFQVDQITQVVPDGEMSFRVQFGQPTFISAVDTVARVKVDGTAYNRFAALLSDGSSHTIDMDSPQQSADGRRQFAWASWSDGGAQSHTITGSLAGATITADVVAQYKVQVTVSGAGSVASTPGVDLAGGAFRDRNSTIQITATAGGNSAFDRWTGDLTSTSNPLDLVVDKPYNLTAVFSAPLALGTVAPPGPVMGKAYSYSMPVSGGNWTNTWAVISGALPPGLSIAGSGLLGGVPTEAGSFSAVVRVTSGAQSKQATVDLTVTEPSLALNAVLPQVLGTAAGSLSADDVTYLDLLGNKNGALDLGDFLAWVNHANVAPAAPAAAPGGDQ